MKAIVVSLPAVLPTSEKCRDAYRHFHGGGRFVSVVTHGTEATAEPIATFDAVLLGDTLAFALAAQLVLLCTSSTAAGAARLGPCDELHINCLPPLRA